MPLTDYASIILSQTNPRQAAIRSWASYRRQRREKQDAEINGFINAIGDVPNLIKQKQEEDDVKSVSDTFLGSLAQDGDLEGGMQAVKMLRPRTAAGSAAAMKLAIQMDTLRRNRMADKAEQERLKIAKENAAYASGERTRQAASEDDLSRLLQPAPDQEAMMGMSSVPLDSVPMTSPSLSDPGLVEAWLGQGNTRLGDPGVSNLLSVREQNARTAAAAVDRSREAEANRASRERIEKEKAAAAAAKPAPYASTIITKDEAEMYGDPRLVGKPRGILSTYVQDRERQAKADKGLSPEEAAFLGDPSAAGVPLDVYKAKHAGERDATPLNPDQAELLMLRESVQQKGKLYAPWMDPADRATLDAEIKLLEDKQHAIIERNRTPAKRVPAGAKPTGSADAPDPFLDAMPPAAREDFLKMSPAEQAKVRKAMGSK